MPRTTCLLQSDQMSKAKKSHAISEAADPFQWASDVLVLRFDEVASFGGAVLVEWNTNAVHDMRVALRRLRSAFRDLSQMIDSKSIRRINSELKKVAATLGDVRDLDVAILALEELFAETKDDAIKTGIHDLSDELKNERENAHARAQKTLNSISIEDLRNRFLQQIESEVRQQELFRPAELTEVGRGVIESRLDDLCSLGDSIYMPFDGTRLHELRIAAKRLRYAIELFASAWPDQINGFAKEISKFQEYLGEVHDCGLWIEKLSKRLAKKVSRKAARSAYPLAAVWLLSRFVDSRGRNYRKAVELWLEWTANGFVERLGSTVASG